MALSAEDKATIVDFKRQGVLQDIEPHRLDQKEGVVLVTCGDGDRFFDIFNWQVRMQAGQRMDPRIHLLSWNGGALALAEDSPLNRDFPNAHEYLLKQIEDACALKSIGVVALYAHAPCGAAYKEHLRFRRVTELLFNAKYRVKNIPRVKKAVCFSHVDYDGMLKRSYHMDHREWFSYVERGTPRSVESTRASV